MASAPRRWSREEAELARRLWGQGLPAAEVAERLGRTVGSVQGLLSRSGPTSRRRPPAHDWTRAEDAELGRLASLGIGAADVAALLGREEADVVGRASRLVGVELGPKGDDAIGAPCAGRARSERSGSKWEPIEDAQVASLMAPDGRLSDDDAAALASALGRSPASVSARARAMARRTA